MRTDTNTPSYRITADEKSVCAVSNFYIPYEPEKRKGDAQQKALQFRRDLRASILGLRPDEHELLLASYEESPKNRFYDVENMLFYNIGGNGFGRAAPTQLAFLGDEARFSAAEAQADLGPRMMYAYRIVSVEAVRRIIAGKAVLAHWERIAVDEKLPKGPARYFSAIRKQSDRIEVTEKTFNKTLFGVKIELTTSYSSHPAAAMKPLLDGVICAFHGEENHTRCVLRDAFSGQADALISDCGRLNLFGSRAYVKGYGGGRSFIWDPQDERLQFGWIIVKKGESPSMSGTIYEW